MPYFFEGIKLGLALSLIVGPIFFSLVQAGVEEGYRAGTMVGLGVWSSDALFIGAVYWGLSYIAQVARWPQLELYMGIAGSLILLGFGLFNLLGKMPDLDFEENGAVRSSSYWALWLKGFLVNTINPFSFFFWLGISSSILIDGDVGGADALWFFGGIMGTVMLSDNLKVLMAKHIRSLLRPVHVLWFRRISGLVFLGFGLVLLYRVML